MKLAKALHLAVSTGSRAHYICLVEQAKRLDLRWNPYRGVINTAQQVIASETEEDIFKALNLEWINPENRER